MSNALLDCGCDKCLAAHETLHAVRVNDQELRDAISEAFYAGARWSEAVARYGRCGIGSPASVQARDEATAELGSIKAIADRLIG